MLRNEDRLYHVVVSFPSVCANQFFIFKFKRNEAICCLIGVGIGISCCLMYRWLRSTFYSLGYLSHPRRAITSESSSTSLSSSLCIDTTTNSANNCCCRCSCSKLNQPASVSYNNESSPSSLLPIHRHVKQTATVSTRRRPPRGSNLYSSCRYTMPTGGHPCSVSVKNQNSQSTSSGCSSRAISEQKEIPGFITNESTGSTSRVGNNNNNKRSRVHQLREPLVHNHYLLEHVQARLVCHDLVRMFYRQFQRNYKLRPRFSRRYFRKSLLLAGGGGGGSTILPSHVTKTVTSAIKKTRPVLMVTSASFATGEHDTTTMRRSINYATRSRSASLSESVSQPTTVDYNNNNSQHIDDMTQDKNSESSFGTRRNLLLTRIMSDRSSDSNHSSLSEFGDVNDSAFDLTDNMIKASNTSLFAGRNHHQQPSSTVDKSIEEALFHIDKLKEEMSDLCGDLDQLYATTRIDSSASTTTTTTLSRHHHNQKLLVNKNLDPELNEQLLMDDRLNDDMNEKNEFYSYVCSYFDTILNDELTNGVNNNSNNKTKKNKSRCSYKQPAAVKSKRSNYKNNSYNRLFKMRSTRRPTTTRVSSINNNSNSL